MHQKLKATPGVYLLGFMGCGKSTVGKKLAGDLGWEFIDLDLEIEKNAGRPIPQLFESLGEGGFREIESHALEQQIRLVRAGGARVISLGGGTFAQTENRQRISDCGLSIWLQAPVDDLWERVRQSEEDRPLARDRDRFFELYAERQSLYALADHRVSAAAPPDQIVAAILDLNLV